jgi:two-component system OmpR family response regulator
MLRLRTRSRVLLLDDDHSMQRLVQTLLKRAGFRVDVVTKGNEAIEKIRSTKYDAVLLDLMMPHEGGMTVLSHLRGIDPAMLQKVVLLTAAPQSILRGIEAEVFGVVRKPFEHADLVAAVTRCVEGS